MGAPCGRPPFCTTSNQSTQHKEDILELAQPAIKRGILRAFNSGTYRAEVSIAGSLSTTLTDVPVNQVLVIKEQ